MARYRVLIERTVIQRQFIFVEAATEEQVRDLAVSGEHYSDDDWDVDDTLCETSVTSVKEER